MDVLLLGAPGNDVCVHPAEGLQGTRDAEEPNAVIHTQPLRLAVPAEKINVH